MKKEMVEVMKESFNGSDEELAAYRQGFYTGWLKALQKIDQDKHPCGICLRLLDDQHKGPWLVHCPNCGRKLEKEKED